MSIGLIFLVVAFILFLLAAFGVPSGRVALMPLGLALWVLALMIGEHAIR